MTIHFFRNRWYRSYFQLLDAFEKERCPLCCLLSQKERAIMTTLLASHDPTNRRRIFLKALCALHRSRIKGSLFKDPSFLAMLKRMLGVSLRELARPSKAPAATWKIRLHAFIAGCPICGPLSRKEKNLCRALIQFLDDVEFWKAFQKAPLLCLDHLEKCLAMAGTGRGFQRLLDDQSTKLNNLLNELVRFEATGTYEESKATALNWLADFACAPVSDAGLTVPAEDNRSERTLSEPRSDGPIDGHDPEGLLFENEKLSRKVRDLIQRLNEVETRAASLHYRCAELSETNKRLEMGYTGASTQARGLAKLVQDLREEIKGLKQGNAEHSAKAAS